MRSIELLIRREERGTPLLSQDDEDQLVKLWEASVREQLFSGNLLGQSFAGPALFAWRRIKGNNFKEAVRLFSKEDERFIELSAALGVSIFSSSSGDVASWSPELISEFGDETSVRHRAKQILADAPQLKNEEKASLLALAHGKAYAVQTLEPAGNY